MTWAYDAIRWLSKAMTRGNGAPLRWHDAVLRQHGAVLKPRGVVVLGSLGGALRRRDIALGPQSAAQKLQGTLLKLQSAKGVLT